MKNFEKFKTVDERVKGFNAFCDKHKRCKGCPFESVKHGLYCEFAWLELEAEEEKPEPCPFCGKECSYSVCRDDNCGVVACNYCGYRSAHTATVEGAIMNHNRVARAVMAAKEREVKLWSLL